MDFGRRWVGVLIGRKTSHSASDEGLLERFLVFFTYVRLQTSALVGEGRKEGS